MSKITCIAIALFCLAFLQCSTLNNILKEIANSTTQEQQEQEPSPNDADLNDNDTKKEKQRKSAD